MINGKSSIDFYFFSVRVFDNGSWFIQRPPDCCDYICI